MPSRLGGHACALTLVAATTAGLAGCGLATPTPAPATASSAAASSASSTLPADLFTAVGVEDWGGGRPAVNPEMPAAPAGYTAEQVRQDMQVLTPWMVRASLGDDLWHAPDDATAQQVALSSAPESLRDSAIESWEQAPEIRLAFASLFPADVQVVDSPRVKASARTSVDGEGAMTVTEDAVFVYEVRRGDERGLVAVQRTLALWTSVDRGSWDISASVTANGVTCDTLTAATYVPDFALGGDDLNGIIDLVAWMEAGPQADYVASDSLPMADDCPAPATAAEAAAPPA